MRARLADWEAGELAYGAEGCGTCGHTPGEPVAVATALHGVIEEHAPARLPVPVDPRGRFVFVDRCRVCWIRDGAVCRTVRWAAAAWSRHPDYPGRPIKAADLPDRRVLKVVDDVNAARGYCSLADLVEALNAPRKVVQAKLRRLMRRGLLEGCYCGCSASIRRPPVVAEAAP